MRYYLSTAVSAALKIRANFSVYCLCNFSKSCKAFDSVSLFCFLTCLLNLCLTSDLMAARDPRFEPFLNFSKSSFKCFADSCFVSVVTGGNGAFKVYLFAGSAWAFMLSVEPKMELITCFEYEGSKSVMIKLRPLILV